MTLVLIFPTNLLFSITLSKVLFSHRCRIFRFQTLLGHAVLSLYAKETTFYVHWSASSVNNLNFNNWNEVRFYDFQWLHYYSYRESFVVYAVKWKPTSGWYLLRWEIMEEVLWWYARDFWHRLQITRLYNTRLHVKIIQFYKLLVYTILDYRLHVFTRKDYR